MTEEELRQQGFESWDDVERCFLWNELSKDFIRQLVEYDTIYKTQLEHHLLMAFHGYATFASFFYKNMYIYLKSGLAEQKELECYSDRVYQLYSQKYQEELNASRSVYKFVDGTGRVLESWVM